MNINPQYANARYFLALANWKLGDVATALRITSYNVCYTKLLRTLVQEVENGCVVELRHVSEGCEGYPFPFTITVRYTLSESKLHFEFMVVNTGNTNMPFGFGS